MVGNGPARLRTLTERAVLNALSQREPVRVSDLMASTELARPTVADALRSLESKGWIARLDRIEGGIGRPALQYARRWPRGYVLGVDFGYYAIAVTIHDLAGNTIHRLRRVLERQDDPGYRATMTGETIGDALTHAEIPADDVWQATAVSATSSAADLSAALRAAVSAPTYTSISPEVLARAEFETLCDGPETLMFFWLGRRPTVSIIIGGRSHAGSHGLAGDLSRLGNDDVSAVEGQPPYWPPPGAAADLNYEHQSEAAYVQKDPVAQQYILAWFDAFASVIVTLTAGLDPNRIVLGGPMAQLGEVIVERLRIHLQPAVAVAPELTLRDFHDWDVAESAASYAEREVIAVTLGSESDPVPAFTRGTFASAARRKPAGTR